MNESDFLAIFQTELDGELQRATELTLALEKAPEDNEILNGLMREFHTIKGAARAIQFDEIKDTAHHLEDIYHALLEKKIKQRPILIDITLYTIDLIKNILSQSLAQQPLPDYQKLEKIVQHYMEGGDPEVPHSTAHHGQSNTGSDVNSEQQTGDSSKAEDSTAPSNGVIDDQNKNQNKNQTKNQTKNQKSTDERLMDNLFNLSGEVVIAVSSFDPQRTAMRKVAQGLSQFQRQLEREGLHGLSESLQHIINNQTEALDCVDSTENRMRFLSEELDDQISAARLVALDNVFSSYPRMIRDLAKELGKSCELTMEGEQTRIDRGVLEAVSAPILHLIRNAIDHGIEPSEQRQQSGKSHMGRISIRAIQLGAQIQIHIQDDGSGINMEGVKKKVLSRGDTTEERWDAMDLFEQHQFLFLPGFSMASSVTDISGRGVGLDVVKSCVEKVGGRVAVDSQFGQGTHFTLELPLSLSLTRCLLVEGGKHPFFGIQHYAFPENDLENIQRINPADIRLHEGRETVRINDQSLPLFSFANLMGLAPLKQTLEEKYVLVLGNTSPIALVVEQVIEEQAIVRRRFDERLGKLPNIDGVSLLRNGAMALIVDMKDLYQTLSDSATRMDSVRSGNELQAEDQSPTRILVVEDSQTVREVEKHFLESAGFEVSTAVDGVDGFNKIRTHNFDLIISDIDMPRMNGIEMIEKVRGEDKFAQLPIIVVSYKDRVEDKQAALTAGANEYVVKSEFDTEEMIQTILRLIDSEDIDAFTVPEQTL